MIRSTITVAAVLLCLVSVACGPTEDSKSPSTVPFDHSTLGEPLFTGVEVSSRYVEMVDSTRIAVDIYLPAEGPADQFPTIFQYTPYHRSSFDASTGEVSDQIDRGTAPFFTSHGYAMVVADMRGTGASSGWLLDFMPEIWDDGRQVVDWIAAQPWSDGNVGMMGGSYVGWSQTATASQRPAALKAIAPSVIPLEGYTGEIYPGGVFAQGFINAWTGAVNALHRNHVIAEHGIYPVKPALDEDGDGELTDEIPLDVDGSGSFLDDPYPPIYADGQEREHVYFYVSKEHSEKNYDYAESTREARFIDAKIPLGYSLYDLGPNAHIEAIMESGIPVYHFGGWFDGFARGTTELFSTMGGAIPQKMAMFPGYHSMVRGGFWERDGYDAETPVQSYLNEHLRFFDHYLKGIDNGIDTDPPISIYVINGGGWRFEDEWPLAREQRSRLYFGPEGRLAYDPDAGGADDYTADFNHSSTFGSTSSNRWLALAGSTPDALPWRTDKADQVLVYDTLPLETPMEVTGHPIVNLAVSSTANHGDFFVYLEDVDPDGNALLVAEGNLRAGFAGLVDNDEIVFSGEHGVKVKPELPWHGYEEAQYVDGILADGVVVELVFDLSPISWVFQEGHKIRLAIAAADYPTFRLHPKLSPANDPDDPGNIVPTITVHRTAEHQSWLELPVIAIPSS